MIQLPDCAGPKDTLLWLRAAKNPPEEDDPHKSHDKKMYEAIELSLVSDARREVIETNEYRGK
jgi:hypothetical protein